MNNIEVWLSLVEHYVRERDTDFSPARPESPRCPYTTPLSGISQSPKPCPKSRLTTVLTIDGKEN
ncbi:MAG: hypothetical protein PHR14_09715 [Oscillospiraceae bacterium]|nr:hypothetical protein [Oscillospiraceae bacterium]